MWCKPAAGVVLGSAVPAFLADQRYEPDSAEAFLPENSVLLLDQLLDQAGIADGHDDPPVGCELLDPRTRYVASARRGEDRVVRRLFAPTLGPVAFDDLDIAVAETPHPFARDLDQFVLPLDRDDPL